ncbi:MAG: tetratricopeptide repeat protein [Candidatus Abyssubacteria bacterium]|nr:tetratricopeptide repeat protein [Candidatus Abyssubacteria bacterium]
MIIGMLMTLAIIGLLYAGPTFENTWVAVAVYGGLIVGAILAFWYSGRLSGGIADLILGGSGGKVKETYSLAEKYAAEHKYKDAVEVYRRAIEKDNKNPTPRLKLADLYYKLRSIDNSIRCMEEASQLPKGMSEAERCTVINRIADLYLHHKRDPASAVRVLRGIIEKYPAGKYAVYARERIVQIKKDA